MKLNKKTIRIAYWAVRIIAISLALLLFSVTGIVATLTMTHAHGLTSTHNNQFLDIFPTDTLTVTTSPTNTPSPTPPVPPTPTPAQQPTVILRRTPPVSTPTKATTPPIIVKAAATRVTLGPPSTTPTATVKTTPTKTPVSTSTPNTAGIQTPTIPGGIDTHTTTQATSSNNRATATITPFIRSIIGTSAIVLLLSASVLVMVLWKKGVFATLLTRGITAPVRPSPIQASSPAMNGQVSVASYSSYNALPTEAVSAPSIAQHTMFPFGIQGIAQSSPLLGATPSAQLNTPVSPASSNFKPLLSKTSNNQALATMDMEPTIDTVATQPTLQAASAQAPHTSGPVEVAFRLSQMHTPIPPSLQIMPPTYQFPQQDPFLEALMHEAQMGLFALPGKAS